MTIDYSVTRRALSLGSADSVTGWYAKVWTETTTEDVIIISKAESYKLVGMGTYVHYDAMGFTQDPFSEGDEIKDSADNYWEVKSQREVYNGDAFIYRELQLAKLPIHYDRPATSGTWHLDSDSAITDVRYRQKDFLNTYLSAADITKDDGVTLAPYLLSFSKPDYPITMVFVTKGMYLVFSIDNGESEGIIGADKAAYAYHESVPIELFAINRADCTAINLIEKGFSELKRILEDYPTGSIRKMGKITETTEYTNAPILYSQKCVMEYTRAKA